MGKHVLTCARGACAMRKHPPIGLQCQRPRAVARRHTAMGTLGGARCLRRAVLPTSIDGGPARVSTRYGPAYSCDVFSGEDC